MTTKRKVRLKNQIVLDVAAIHDDVWAEEASKWKEPFFSVSTVMGKREEQTKDHPVIKEYRNRSLIIRYSAKEVKYATEISGKIVSGRIQRRGEPYNRNFYLTVFRFTCYMI